MMCNFKVGQKVVCIANELPNLPGFIILGDYVQAELNRIYTIRAIDVSPITNRAVLRFVEIEDQLAKFVLNGEVAYGIVGYHSHCFRPLVKRATDISIFKAMLNTSKQGVPA
jgi:hypothetical protein